jgi:hypothetical protein
MPNYKVFNDSTGPLIVEDLAQQAGRDGTFFVVSTGSQAVVANGFLAVQINIPANVSRTVNISRVSGGASVNTTIDLLFNATFAAAGTALSVINGNAGSTRTSITTAKFISQATDPTSGGTRLNSIIHTGGPLVYDVDGRYIIPSGVLAYTFYVRVINNTNQSNLLSINVSFWES